MTGIGMSSFLGGVVLFVLAVPVRGGTGLELLFGAAPVWAYAACLLGGPPVALLGAGVGIRYGNFERYHKDYDEETGTIDSGHPFAAFAAWVSKDEGPPADPPEKFVPSRWLLAAVCFVPVAVVLGYLLQSGVFGTLFLVIAGVVLLGGGAVAFVVAELVARDVHDEYG